MRRQKYFVPLTIKNAEIKVKNRCKGVEETTFTVCYCVIFRGSII